MVVNLSPVTLMVLLHVIGWQVVFYTNKNNIVVKKTFLTINRFESQYLSFHRNIEIYDLSFLLRELADDSSK